MKPRQTLTDEQQIAVLQLMEDACRAYREAIMGEVDPPDPPDPPDELQPTGSITVLADDTVIENKDVTGRITIDGKSRCTVRNCRIQGTGNLIYCNNANGITIEGVELICSNPPAGQNFSSGEDTGIHLNAVSGAININRVTTRHVTGLYAHRCTGKINVSSFEGHNTRGPVGSKGTGYRGQLIQLNQCSGGALIDGFSCENDPQNSCPEDIINIHYNTGAQIVIRNGVLDGNTAPTGVMVMIEQTANVLVEDVDAIRHMNGAFSCYDNAAGNTFRRCRAKDQITRDQGRGPASSNYCNFVSAPGCSGTRFEQVVYQNISSNLAWDTAKGGFAAKDWAAGSFTPRAPIRNQFSW
jgi:hypothetical protein